MPLGERRGEVNGPIALNRAEAGSAGVWQATLPFPPVMLTGHGIDMHATLTKPAMCASLAALIAGCAGGGATYPSLALRPFETAGASAPAAPPPEPIRPATDPARIAQLRAAAEASHSAFLAQEDRAARLARAAAGQAVESAPRAAAMVALADLDAQRGKTAGTLASVDALAAEAAVALAPDPALSGAQADIAALVAREDAGIARIWEVIGS